MKDFLLIANTNACTYKEFFPLLKERKVSMGVEMPKEYDMPDGATKKFGNICWYTTLHTPDKRKLILTKKYKRTEYPHYDNYNAIEVGRIKDIPYDYDCVMGVPITIFQYDLDNVEIVRFRKGDDGKDLSIEGKEKYARILIKKKIEVRGIWNDKREEADFIVKGAPTYLDEKHKSFQGPVVDGKAKYARILIKKKIVIMGEEVIHNNDTKINGKERYRRVCIRLARR